MTKDQHDSAIEEAANNGSINALKRLLQKRKLGSLDSHDEEEGDGDRRPDEEPRRERRDAGRGSKGREGRTTRARPARRSLWGGGGGPAECR